MEQKLVEILNNQYTNIIASYAADGKNGWRIIGIDYDGFELANGDNIIRREFKLAIDASSDEADMIAFMIDKDNLK